MTDGTGRRLVEIFPDAPVEEEAALAFEFEGLARTLAALVWNAKNPTPFTAVVKGDWGRGKTTLLRRTRRLLDSPPDDAPFPRRERIHTLWLNAWKYPDETTVLAGLLGELLRKLGAGKLKEQGALKVAEHRGRLYKLVLGLAAPWLVPIVDEGGRLSTPTEEARAFYDTFRALFAEAWRILQEPDASFTDLEHRDVEKELSDRQESAALAVFLDDLDRCRPARILEVMEAINLFLDLPGVCFYLGVDWTRLRQILAVEMPGREEAFLEKIVQVSLDLPPVSEAGVEGYVELLLKERALGKVLAEDDGIAAVAEALGSSHPRRVKRFLNDLSVGLAVLANTDRLGDGERKGGEPRVPEKAVAAWHLLLAALPGEEAEDLRASLGNVDRFLRGLRASGEGEEDGDEAGTKLPERIRSSEPLRRWLGHLSALDLRQRNTLVHFGSPPRIEEPARPRRAAGIGHDLLDPNGGAWVEIPAGSFDMGSDGGTPAERPVHRVNVPAFRISRFPVTNDQYARYVAVSGKTPPGHWAGGVAPTGLERHPVVNVSWSDARAFCEWLERRLGTGVVDLPSEAEWEYAARGPDGREHPWGPEEPDADRANFGNNLGTTTPVDAYPAGATPMGVFDLAGNVWEWCKDEWHDSYEGAPTDGSAWEGAGSASRVLRGGSFRNDARTLRAASRHDVHPGYRYDGIGFRVVWRAAGGQA